MSKIKIKLRTLIFTPMGIASVYLISSTLWIIYSDLVLETLLGNGELYVNVQTIKGLFFVCATAIVLYLFVKNGQRQLKESVNRAEEHKSRYRELVDSSPFIIAVFKQQKVLFCNKACVEKFGAETESDIVGKSIKLFLHPQYWESSAKRIQDVLDGGKNERLIAEKFITLYGNVFPVEVRLQRIMYNGEPAIQVIAEDVSERLKREQILEQMVKEKTVLLSEVHHRVKNNMAIISALMQLQSYETGNEEVADILDKSVSRIKSIALIHENLYEVQNLSEIELAKNIRDLVQQISRRYSKETDVWFSFDLQKIKLNINQAVSVGLFLNEVMSELFKVSAFSVTREVVISTTQNKDKVTLSISEKLTKQSVTRQRMFEERGFLIDLMAQQLDGDLVINQSKTGFEISLAFNKVRQIKGSSAHQLVVNG